MAYALDTGQYEQTLARQAFQAGQPLPDAIANAPQLHEWLLIYYQAFNDLDSERSHSMGITQIPWSAILNYAKANEFTEEQTDDLFYLVREMDRAHCKKIELKMKANGSKP